MSGRHPLLEAEGLVRVFGSGRTAVRAVDGVDLTADLGEITLVMGPSGSGKTTLLTMLGGLLHPTEGRIRVGDVEVTRLGTPELARFRRSTVGFVFQTFNLLETLSARENVEVALNVAGVTGRAAHDRATELLDAAGLGDRLDFRARDLSGGEKQRVSIARALANRPRLLLGDEPTANLDSRHGQDVMELLRHLAREQGCGVVAVSHDPRLQGIADRVLWLEDGRIRLDGAANERGRAELEPAQPASAPA
ncbi:MAG TPA: ABC transporter ATP-binding protein [Gaiellaceae bacterium]|nr:ABC transporter ATP-binding protein [Gaiellaceae bacterium]